MVDCINEETQRPFTAKTFKVGKKSIPVFQKCQDEFLTACLGSHDKVVRLEQVFDKDQRVHILEPIRGGTLADLIQRNILKDTYMPLNDV